MADLEQSGAVPQPADVEVVVNPNDVIGFELTTDDLDVKAHNESEEATPEMLNEYDEAVLRKAREVLYSEVPDISSDKLLIFTLVILFEQKAVENSNFFQVKTVTINEAKTILQTLIAVIRELADSTYAELVHTAIEKILQLFSNYLDIIMSKDFDPLFRLFVGIAVGVQECLSFQDLIRFFSQEDLVNTPSKDNGIELVPLSQKDIEALDSIRNTTEEELAELIELYDPEMTGSIGMNDYFLLLKDLFLNRPNLVLHTGDNVSVFEADNSYKEFSLQADKLLFDFVGLNKLMYKSTLKNVCYNRPLFWHILALLLRTQMLYLLAVDEPQVAIK